MFGFTLFQGKQRKKIERSVAITNKVTLPIKKGYPIASCCNGNIHQGSTLFLVLTGTSALTIRNACTSQDGRIFTPLTEAVASMKKALRTL